MWFHISKDEMKGEGKKLRPIRNGPFTILEKIGNNVVRLDLPIYMQMYSIVNVDNLRLYEPPVIMDTKEVGTVPTVHEFAPEYLDELPEDIILHRRTGNSQWGDVEYFELVSRGCTVERKNGWKKKE